MVMQAATASPSSFQLRWGLLRSRAPPPRLLLLVRFRAAAPARNTRLACAAAPAPARNTRLACAAARAGNGGGAEPSAARESWSAPESPSSSAADTSFSGWSVDDSDEGSSPRRYGGLPGIIGAGLAGILLALGLSFASLSLRGKISAGDKKQMEPLTSKQEIMLNLDDQTEQVDSEETSSTPVPDSDSLGINDIRGSKSGTDEDCIFSLKENEPASNAIHVGINSAKSLSGQETDFAGNIEDSQLGDTVSHSEKTQSATAIGTIDMSTGSPGLDQNTTNSDNNDVVGLHKDLEDSNIVDPSSNAGVETSFPEEQTGDLVSDEPNMSKSISDPSSLTLSESVAIDGVVDLQPNFVETQSNLTVVDMEVSNGQDIGPVEKPEPTIEDSKTLESRDNRFIDISSETEVGSPVVMDDKLSSVLVGNSLNEDGSSEVNSISQLTDQTVSEPDSYHFGEATQPNLTRLLQPEILFSNAGIPAPSAVSSALQVNFGKVLVPATVDPLQAQALAALQVLKVIEPGVQPGDICTRREYARWLVSASSLISRSATSKVHPAMYIENVTELAFDDVTPEDSDFPSIQGLAEAGLISSKLSRLDMDSHGGEQGPMLFSPESPLSRQDLVSWKMALEKRQLPEVNRQVFRQKSGYIDIDKIHPDAWPAIMTDLSSGESGIISLAFGYTRLFQPDKPVTKAQAAVALSTGDANELVGEELTRMEAETLAETAVAAHTALVAEVEKDLNATFEKELAIEKEKIDAMEKLAAEAKAELENLRKEREEESNVLMRGRATVESEMEILSKLRNEVEEQLQGLLSNRIEITIERDRVNKLRIEAENENQVITQLQYELEVERKALAMARAWAEDEAKKAREQARALEEARERWEKRGLKIIVDEDLQESASDGITWINAGKQVPSEETVSRDEKIATTPRARQKALAAAFTARAQNLVENLKALLAEVKGKSAAVIERIIQKILSVVSQLKHQVSEASQQATAAKDVLVSKAGKSMQEAKYGAIEIGVGIRDGVRRAAEDCREGVGKLTQRFKA